MLTYPLKDTGSDSLYIHLYKCIRQDILSGALPPLTKLPSKRSFAKNLGVSVITVENAYAQLQSEGYISSIPKKGFFVEAIAGSQSLPQTEPVRENALPDSPEERYVIDFVSNRTDTDSFPFSIWAKLSRQTLSEKREELLSMPPCGGIMELRTAICRHLKDFRDMDVTPEQVIVGAGTEYLYGLLIQLLGFGKKYAVENPGYGKLKKIYQSHHVSVNPVSLDHEGILIPSLENSGADVAHITPSHHFPSGVVTSIGRRYELLGWAVKKEGRYIIEDDYDSEFRLSGKPIPALQSIDRSERVVYINTFSKSLASTVRISYMVLPPHLLERYYQKLDFYSCTVSNFEQYTLALFLSEGYFEKHINRMRTHYKAVRDRLLDGIKKSRFSHLIAIKEEDAGLHFLMRLKTSLSDSELTKQAAQNKLHIACLSEYYFDGAKDCQHTIVINYSGLTMQQIPEAIRKLEELIVQTDTTI